MDIKVIVNCLRALCASALALTAAGAASAQGPFGLNIDIDFNFPGEPGSGVPSAGYGAAANQPGAWSSIGFGSGPFTLVGLNGSPSPAQISRNQVPASLTFDNGAGGDYAKLINDGDRIDSTAVVYTITGLPAGNYSVYTYAGAPFFSTIATRITINGVQQTVANAPTDFTFSLGGTHARHNITHPGGPLTITAERASISGVVNGFQIVPAAVPLAAITSPVSCAYVGGVVEVRGTASSPNLVSWVLQVTGGDSGTWTTIAVGNTNVVNGVLGNWNLTGQRPCAYTLRLLVNDSSGYLETLRSVIGAAQGDTSLDGLVNFIDVNTVLLYFGQTGP